MAKISLFWTAVFAGLILLFSIIHGIEKREHPTVQCVEAS